MIEIENIKFHYKVNNLNTGMKQVFQLSGELLCVLLQGHLQDAPIL